MSSLLLLAFLRALSQAWTPSHTVSTTRSGAVLNHLAKATTLFGGLLLPRLPVISLDVTQDPSPTAVFLLGGYRIPADQYTSYQRRLLADIPSLAPDSVTLLPDRQGEAGEVDDILRRLNKEKPKKVMLIGHSRGASVAVRVAARLPSFSPRLDLCGLLLLDPVDEQEKIAGSSNEWTKSSRNISTPSSCLPLLRSLPPSLPIVIVALPFSGVNSYYKSPIRNVCAPPGRDARAFYIAAAAAAAANGHGGASGAAATTTPAGSAGTRANPDEEATASHPFPSSFSFPLLLTLPFAGHLQLLDARPSLPFAELCGVGKVNTDREVQVFVAAVIVACCEWWVGGKGGKGEGLRERIRRRVEEGGLSGSMRGSVVWEGGGGEDMM